MKSVGPEEDVPDYRMRPSLPRAGAAALRTGVVAAAVMLAAGCATTTSSTISTSTRTMIPARAMPHGLSRADAIGWARSIDPCALIDRDQLASIGTVGVYGTSSTSTACAAHVDDGTQHGLDVGWSIAFVPTDFTTSPLGAIEEIDGVKVRMIDTAQALPPAARSQLVESACNLDMALDNAIAVRMSVSMQRDQDACAKGRQLVPSVLAKWREHPKQGSSPATTVTVLTTASPCAVVPQLQKSRSLAFDWNDQSLDTCSFKLDGNDVLVTMAYRTREQVAMGEPRTFGGHVGYHGASGTETSDRVIVGAEFTGGDAGHEAKRVPVVEVWGDGDPVVSDVTTAVLAQLPS